MAKRTAEAVEPASPREVREWAKTTGREVSERGRLSAALREAFTAATGRPVA